MKIAVVYHSVSGNTRQIAELVAAGARAAGAEVSTMSLDTIDAAFVAEARAVIVGTPTYYSACSWQVKQWFDTTAVPLGGKLGAVFATANFFGGGSETAELGVVAMMLVKGMLVYSGGVAEGAPYTHFGAVTVKAGDEPQQVRARLLGERVARKAAELFGGR